jgi:hypothetical protein
MTERPTPGIEIPPPPSPPQPLPKWLKNRRALKWIGIERYFLNKYFRHEVFAEQLKVPKRENFSLAFFAQSEPTWVCDLGSREKNRIFYQMTPVFDGFWFFAAY